MCGKSPRISCLCLISALPTHQQSPWRRPAVIKVTKVPDLHVRDRLVDTHALQRVNACVLWIGGLDGGQHGERVVADDCTEADEATVIR